MQRTLKILSILEEVCGCYVENSEKSDTELSEARKSKKQGEITFSLMGPTVAARSGASLIYTLCDILGPVDGDMTAQEAIQIVAMATKLSFLYATESLITERMKRLLEGYAPGFSVKDARPKKKK